MKELKGVKRWIVLKSISTLLVFYALMLPMMISMMILAINFPIEGNIGLTVSTEIMKFAYFTTAIAVGAKLIVFIGENLKEKHSESNAKKLKLAFNTSFFAIVGFILLLHYLFVFNFFTNFEIISLILGIVYLFAAYYYIVFAGKLSDIFSKISDKKIEEFKETRNNE